MDVLSPVMDLGVHEHEFCSVLKFKTWYKILKGKMEHVVDSNKSRMC